MSRVVKSDLEGIEFYTVLATGESGMSQSGLARVVNTPRQTVENLLQDLVAGNSRSKCLEAFIGKKLWLLENGLSNAKIVKDDVCAAVIEHYAFEARKTTQTAIDVYRRFAARGVRGWIQEITGWEDERKRYIVKALVSQEYTKWQKRFEDEFFEEAYRINGWQKTSSGHPSCMGRFIKKTVYNHLPEGTTEKLEQVNPRTDKGRKRKHHQHLKGLGLNVLGTHKSAVLAVMRLSPDSNPTRFEQNLQKALGSQIQLELPFLIDLDEQQIN